MPKTNQTPNIQKPSVAKLMSEVGALRKSPPFTPKTSLPFSFRNSGKMSWIAAGIVISMLMGLLVGYFLTKPMWSLPADNSSTGTEPVVPSQPKTVTMHGVIRSLEASAYMQGTHQLVGEDGKMLAVLEPSSKIQDLTFLEGSEVDVEGVASKTVEGDMTVIKVEKVRF